MSLESNTVPYSFLSFLKLCMTNAIHRRCSGYSPAESDNYGKQTVCDGDLVRGHHLMRAFSERHSRGKSVLTSWNLGVALPNRPLGTLELRIRFP